jgi:uncharacterized protein YcfJ
MNTSLIIGLVGGAIAATAIGGFAGYTVLHPEPEFAQVLSTRPVQVTEKIPGEVCKEVVVSEQAPAKDADRLAGTAIGAVAGGLLGNQVGKGNGRVLATVAGAAAGGYAGNQVQKNMQEGNVRTHTETRCKTVYHSKTRVIGYDVRYRLNDKESTVRMEYAPGTQIPVKDGQLQIGVPATGTAG